MSRAIDPFEEYLRKKKVEMLEQKFRDRRERGAESDEEGEEAQQVCVESDDPESEAKVQEEMDDFFQSGQSAGAEAYSKAAGLSEDKVEEIKDALDEVFEEEAPPPQAEGKQVDTFVNFFKQVQDSFDGDPRAELPAAPEVEAAAAAVVEFETAAAEITTEEPAPASPPPQRRLDLTEILLAEGADDDDGEAEAQRIEVLCRLVAKLVERSHLPESEIIEALIKAGVEF